MSPPATPEQAVAFLTALSPSSIRLGLDRIHVALEALGRPERAFPAVHVAGTNGKGSTCAFADSVLRAQGYRVGLYTSPHLVRFNERIRVNGEDIPDRVLGERILEVLERYPDAAREPYPLTYFELGTLVALWHFRQERVDVAVLETGLGGRLDATTAAQPAVTVVTPISFDHMEYLGHTLAAIAGEKAGIFKPGVPAVTTRQAPEALAVIEERARAMGTSLAVEGRDFELVSEGDALAFHGRRTISGLRLGLRGSHQLQNAAAAIAALDALDGRLAVSEGAVRDGLARARWPGRLEELGGEPPVLVDGAHNPAGAEVLVAALDALYPGRRVHLVFGVLGDKDWQPMVRILFPRCASVHLCPPPSPRALPPEQYLEQARSLAPTAMAHASVFEALDAARQQATKDDIVVCAGSLYLVGNVLNRLGAARHGP